MDPVVTEEKPPVSGSPEQGGGAPSEPTGDNPQGSPQAGGTGTPPGPPKGQPQPDPGFEIEFNGQKVKLTKEQLVEHYGKSTDYTKKTQALAEERKKLQTEFQQQLQKSIIAEREKWARDLKDKENPPTPEELNARRIATMEQKIEDDKLDRTLQAVKQKFPNVDGDRLLFEALHRYGDKLDEKAILEHAQEMDNRASTERESILETFLKDDKHPKMAALKQRFIDEYVALKAKDTVRHETGPGGAPGGTGPKKAPTTLDEAEALSRQMLDEAAARG